MTIEPGAVEDDDPDLAGLRDRWGTGIRGVRSVRQRMNVVVEVDFENGGTLSRHYLRVARQEGWKPEEIGFELAMLARAVTGGGVAIARPVPGRDGRLLQTMRWRGTVRHGVLFEPATGAAPSFDVVTIECFGAALATLHATFPRSIGPPRGRVLDIASLCRSVSDGLLRHGAIAGTIRETVDWVHDRLEREAAGWRLPRGFCHGDACPLNAAWDGDRMTFFDFDECLVAPLALDLGGMVPWLRDKPDGDEIWAALLRGYDGVRQVANEERVAFPALALIAELRIVDRLARFSAMPDSSWAVLRDRVAAAVAQFRTGRLAF